MQAWESIQSTVQWIEEHLTERVEIDKLAGVAHLSPFYFQRLFNRLVGKPVMEYVRLRRVANAADHLAHNQRRIVDVALDYGFENHETFTRAFKDAYGLTPEEYRAAPRQLSHFPMPDLSLKYVLVDENVPLQADGIVLEIRRTTLPSPRLFTGFTIQNPIADTPGIDFLGELWNRFHREKEKVAQLLPGGNELGAAYAGEAEGCFTYFAGAEVMGYAEQDGFVHWTLPTGDYVVCAFEAENFYQLATSALNKANDYLFSVWLPTHGLTCGPFAAELYGDTSPEGTAMEIWVKAKTGT